MSSLLLGGTFLILTTIGSTLYYYYKQTDEEIEFEELISGLRCGYNFDNDIDSISFNPYDPSYLTDT